MHYRSSNPIMTDILKVLSECQLMRGEGMLETHNYYPKVKGSKHTRAAALREVSALVHKACTPSLDNNSVFQTLVRLGCSQRHSFTVHHNQFELKPDDAMIQEDVHKLFEKYAVVYEAQKPIFPLIEKSSPTELPKTELDQIKDIIDAHPALSQSDILSLIRYLSERALGDTQVLAEPQVLKEPHTVDTHFCDCGACKGN